MSNRLEVKAYEEEIAAVAAMNLSWDSLSAKTVVVSGATGMIGSYLIDLIMYKNQKDGLDCKVVALGRNEAKARKRLPYFDNPNFSFAELNIWSKDFILKTRADYVIHLASSTHPRQYAANPIGTISVNIDGLQNLLEYSDKCSARLLFASSVEIYGENRGDVNRFTEDYCGYIDCNTLRACYTEAKRLGEAMCQAYRSQKDVSVVIPRIARVYGPTLLDDDSKALSQFIHRVLEGEDVVLKSEGTQRFSYLYVADAVTGLLTVLLDGKDGEAYNLADDSDIQLKDLATIVAKAGGSKVIFDLPDAQEAAGYSKANLALMDGFKARKLGWIPLYNLNEGIEQTLMVLRELGH